MYLDFEKIKSSYYLLCIVLCSFFCHLPYLQKDLIGIHVWRQTQTQLNIQNFYREDNNILHPMHDNLMLESRVQQLEFPLMQWLIAQVERVFGEQILVTRLCIFIIGIFTLLAFYKLTRLFFAEKFTAFLATWCFNFSWLFYYYTINPLPDNFALCCSMWALYYFFSFLLKKNRTHFTIYGVMLSLAALSKLPFILFSAPALLYFTINLWQKKYSMVWAKQVGIFLLTMAIPLFWYLKVIPTWKESGVENAVIRGIFGGNYDKEFLLYLIDYHIKTMFPKIMLSYFGTVFLGLGLAFLVVKKTYLKQSFFYFLVLVLALLLYLLYELPMIDIIHDYYMMPFLPLLYLLVAAGINWLSKYNLGRMLTIILALCLSWYGVSQGNSNWTLQRTYSFDEMFTDKQKMQAIIPPNETPLIIEDVSGYIFNYLLQRKSYTVKRLRNLDDEARVKQIIQRKPFHYLISNNREAEKHNLIAPILDSLLYAKGQTKIWKIKK